MSRGNRFISILFVVTVLLIGFTGYVVYHPSAEAQVQEVTRIQNKCRPIENPNYVFYFPLCRILIYNRVSSFLTERKELELITITNTSGRIGGDSWGYVLIFRLKK